MTTQEHFGTSSSFGTTHINPNPIPFIVDRASHHLFFLFFLPALGLEEEWGAHYPTSLYVQIFQPRLAPRASTHPPRPGSPLSRLSRDADRRQVPRSLPLRKGKPPLGDAKWMPSQKDTHLTDQAQEIVRTWSVR